MKRRDFIKSVAVFMASAAVAGQEVFAQAAKKTAAAVKKVKVFAREGVLGFKKEAPEMAVKANKRCENCKYYKLPSPVDPLCPNEGLCTLPAMKTAMKSEEVYVESKSYCNMWQKATVPAGSAVKKS